MTDRPRKLNRIPFDEAVKRTMERFKGSFERMAHPPEEELTPEQQEVRKAEAFRAYVNLLDLGDYLPPSAGRKSEDHPYLVARRARVAWLETTYPDFKDLYRRVVTTRLQ